MVERIEKRKESGKEEKEKAWLERGGSERENSTYVVHCAVVG